MTEPKPSVKALLLSMTKAQRDQLDLIEALAKALPEGDEDPFLGVEEAQAEFNGIGRGTIATAAAAGELNASRGARGKILVRRSELARWIASRPFKPGPRRGTENDDSDALEDALQTGELVRGAR